MAPSEAPTQAGTAKEEKKGASAGSSKPAADPKPKWSWKTAPKAVATIFFVATFVVMITHSWSWSTTRW